MLGKLTLDVQRYKFMSPGRHRGVTIIGRAIVNPRMMPSCLCKSYSASCHFLISICKMPCLQTNETFYLNLKTPSTLRSITKIKWFVQQKIEKDMNVSIYQYWWHIRCKIHFVRNIEIIRVLFLAQANLIKEFFVYQKFVRSKSIYPKWTLVKKTLIFIHYAKWNWQCIWTCFVIFCQASITLFIEFWPNKT